MYAIAMTLLAVESTVDDDAGCTVESTALRFAISKPYWMISRVDAVTVFFTSLTYSTILTENIGLTAFLPEVRNCTSVC
jgi:hypothetical protein